MTDIERMAAIAAQHVNGGEFANGDFYSPEHRAKWIEAMTLAIEPLRKEMSETALTALSIDSRAMDLQLLCDKQAMRLAEAMEVVRTIAGMLDDPTGGQHVADMRSASATARAFLAKLEQKP